MTTEQTAPQFTPGQSVTWLYTSRGGYGYTTPVKATVVKVARSKIQIEVICIRRGFQQVNEVELKWVKPENLRAKE